MWFTSFSTDLWCWSISTTNVKATWEHDRLVLVRRTEPHAISLSRSLALICHASISVINICWVVLMSAWAWWCSCAPRLGSNRDQADSISKMQWKHGWHIESVSKDQGEQCWQIEYLSTKCRGDIVDTFNLSTMYSVNTVLHVDSVIQV